MVKFSWKYLFISLLILSVAFVTFSCGGGGGGSIDPNPVQPTATLSPVQDVPTPITGSAQGYLYYSGLEASSKEDLSSSQIHAIEVKRGEPGEPGTFITQVSDYIDQNASTEEDIAAWAWAQYEIYSWKPVTENTKLYTWNEEKSVGTIGTEGYFKVPGLESYSYNMDLAIPTGDGYKGVETIMYDPFLTTQASSLIASAVTYMASPSKISIKPGKVEIFKVYASKASALSGLSFVLENTAVGRVYGPIYLVWFGFGSANQSVAYGVFYSYSDQNTTNTNILVKKSGSTVLTIPVSIIGTNPVTYSVSGKVSPSASGLTVKGSVKSDGPSAFAYLDSSGNYKLPQVYSGSRVVTATWDEYNSGGTKVNHFELSKTINVTGNVTGVNFQGTAQPTPTVGVPTATATGVPPTPTNTTVAPTPTNTTVPPTPTNTAVPPTPTPTAKWTTLTSPTTTNLRRIYVSGNESWLLSDSIIYYSSNYPSVQFSPIFTGLTTYNDMTFINQGVTKYGWAVGYDSMGVRTIDTSGTNWADMYLSGISTFNCVSFPNITNGYASGTDKRLHKTTDGGANWSDVGVDLSNGTINTIFFTDNNTGYFGGSSPAFKKTTDGGLTWSSISGYTGTINDIYFYDGTHGWAVGANDILYYNGSSWTRVANSTGQSLNSVFFVSATEGWISGNNGVILHSTDGGATWSTQTSGTTVTLRDVFFTSSTNGYAVGNSGTILRFTNQ